MCLYVKLTFKKKYMSILLCPNDKWRQGPCFYLYITLFVKKSIINNYYFVQMTNGDKRLVFTCTLHYL